jgi:DNA-binding MarR family transcriptional regulator
MSELAAPVTPPGRTSDADFGWALATLSRSYLRQIGEAVADVPGGPRGYQVLTVAAGGSCQNQASMAEMLGLDRTMMTYLVDGLEKEGLVIRTPDPGDRRARRVTLTATGESLLAELRSRVDGVEQRLLSGLAPDAADRFRRDLGALAQSAPADATAACAEDPCTA